MTNGIGVLIQQLSGRSQEHVDLLKSNLNNKIESLKIDSEFLTIKTENNPKLEIFDDGQSCCESRYMVCDDNLNEFIGATLLNIKVVDAPSIETEYDEHEVQFLKLVTNRGTITVSNHNEHNGYYGGFWINWRIKNESN